MASYRAPDFQERAALARAAKQKALDGLRARPVPTEAEIAARKAVRLKQEEAEAQRRARRAAAKLAESEAKAAAVAAALEETQAAERAAQAAIVPVKSEAERKAERDARYAARKSRK